MNDDPMSDECEGILWVEGRMFINSNLFTENHNKVPYEELVKYAGQHVAWTPAGTRILASAADELELDRRLREAGIDPSRVVVEYLPPPDITSIL